VYDACRVGPGSKLIRFLQCLFLHTATLLGGRAAIHQLSVSLGGGNKGGQLGRVT
jgi:hypothetical protein